MRTFSFYSIIEPQYLLGYIDNNFPYKTVKLVNVQKRNNKFYYVIETEEKTIRKITNHISKREQV